MKSIKTKIAAMLMVITLVMGLMIGIYSIATASSSMTENIEDEMVTIAAQVARTVEEALDSDYCYMEALAKHPMVSGAKVDAVEQKKFLLEVAKERNVLDFGYADATGKTLTADLTTYADISGREYYKEALAGARAASDPFEDSTKPGVMIMMMSVPVYSNGNVIGVLYQRADGAYLSNITNKVTFGDTGAAYMSNHEGTNIAHQNSDMVLQQENAILKHGDDPAYASLIRSLKKILEGGSGYQEYTFMGSEKCVGYCAVEGTKWIVVVYADHAELFAGIKRVQIGVVIMTILAILIFSVVGFVMVKKMLAPLNEVDKELGRISDGDFSEHVPQKLLAYKDEMGTLARALDKMQKSLIDTISKVNTSSQHVIEYADNQGKRIDVLMENAESVSATSQEIAASSEEGAASTEQMTQSAAEARTAVESIALRAQDGAKTSMEISERAHDLQETSIRSKENATTVCRDSIAVLEQAIEDSRKVERINELSNAILEIASQTNLLALNASIEAARAGEAGKGFAVVASEIGKLAEDSQHSVTQIMEVTKEVIGSVDHLSGCARSILDFLQDTVMGDYEKMVETGKQYREDASQINNMVMDMSATTEELLATITDMVESLEYISVAVNESATGTTVIAQSNSDIVHHTSEIHDLARKTTDATTELADAMSVFKLS